MKQRQKKHKISRRFNLLIPIDIWEMIQKKSEETGLSAACVLISTFKKISKLQNEKTERG